jgi:regulator of replication initiation timing
MALVPDADTDELTEKLAELQRENQLLEMENNLLALCSERVLKEKDDQEDADKNTRKSSRKGGKKER